MPDIYYTLQYFFVFFLVLFLDIVPVFAVEVSWGRRLHCARCFSICGHALTVLQQVLLCPYRSVRLCLPATSAAATLWAWQAPGQLAASLWGGSSGT